MTDLMMFYLVVGVTVVAWFLLLGILLYVMSKSEDAHRRYVASVRELTKVLDQLKAEIARRR